MERSDIPLDPRHLGVPSDASKMIFEPMIRSKQNRTTILRQHWHYLQTDRNDLPLEPHHLVVPSGVSKMISNPIVRLVQTMHLSCTDTNSLQMERSEIPHDPRHLGVPSDASKTISKPMVRLTHTVHLSCVKILTISKWTELSLEPHHLGDHWVRSI